MKAGLAVPISPHARPYGLTLDDSALYARTPSWAGSELGRAGCVLRTCLLITALALPLSFSFACQGDPSDNADEETISDPQGCRSIHIIDSSDPETTTSIGATTTPTSALTGDTSTDATTNDSSTSSISDATTTASSTSTSTSTSTTSDASTSDSSTSNTSNATTTGVEPKPDGSMCAIDEECVSESCYLIPLLGGFCGECKVDDDCENGGCTLPNPLAGVGASCNKGEVGAGCEDDTVCMDPSNNLCGLVLDASPIIKVQTCGECKVNADCMDMLAPNCSPTISVSDFSGVNTCVADASVENDKACSLVKEGGVPVGNAACMSGKCGVAAVMQVVKIGVCGECFVDEDCEMGTTCQDAFVDTDTGEVVGAKCV